MLGELTFVAILLCFVVAMTSIPQLRLITIAKGEQAIVKVNSDIPITIEFEGQAVTLWAMKGMIFQRIEHPGDDSTQVEVEDSEKDSEPYEETQLMFTPSPKKRRNNSIVPPEHITIRQSLSVDDRKILEELQADLFWDEAGGTQLMD